MLSKSSVSKFSSSTYPALKKEVGGKDNQWKRFQMGWQVGVGLTYNSLYVGVGYAKDFMELCRKTKVGTATITLGYTF